ncbi:sugar kinase [Alkalihalobacillus sp. CinArs1]|uniref:sugar kinase n=1 Tax=Alkalihalobacillus sp. CinArs1 TaxID=2995314 RepID=UPI0022DDF2BE|nr:sugar kinase [Alkalihalobacillus sp. CinArs1]
MNTQLDVITLGETMVLFDAGSNGPLRYVNQFNKRIGGAESNVAIGLSKLGHSVGWVSKIGDEELGHYMINTIRGEGVDISRVVLDPTERTGLYIKEKLTDRNQVYYYRQGSAASKMASSDIDWEYLSNTKIIHLTGITPLLSESCFNLVDELFHFAKKHAIPVSFDPNLRHKLLEKVPNGKERLMDFAKRADILLPGLEEAEYLLGTRDYDEIADFFLASGVKKIAIKNGAIGTYYATSDNERGFVKSYPVSKAIDPIGAGDGFATGVLSGLLNGSTFEEAIDRGSLIGSMVVSVSGDIEGLPTSREIEAFRTNKQDVLR